MALCFRRSNYYSCCLCLSVRKALVEVDESPINAGMLWKKKVKNAIMPAFR